MHRRRLPFRTAFRIRAGAPVALATLTLLLLLGCDGREPTPQPAASAVRPGPVILGEELAAFYRERGFKPVWIRGRKVRPEAATFVQKLEEAALHGLDPSRYGPGRLRQALDLAQSGDPQMLATADLLLSRAYTRFVRDLRRPGKAPITYVDEELRPAPPPSARALLERLAAGQQIEADLGVNPLYDRLARGSALYFDEWLALPQVAVPSGPDLATGASGDRVALLRRRLGFSDGSDRFDEALARKVRRFQEVHGLAESGIADAATLAALNRGYRHYERIIQANMERARAIAPGEGGRFILVDLAGARLWLFGDGRVQGTMRAIVGKPGMATPEMAGLIRYVALNPYWNIPPDLIRERVAKNVVRAGLGYLRRERLQVLTDWADDAPIINPARVNWKAVASGRDLVRVRQLPGPDNMMGKMKFMFPNKLDIYLHDTPDKSGFRSSDRRLSSGCVRVEDAQRLSRWLFKGAELRASGVPEERVDLAEPVPVFITYLTAVPAADGIRFQPDHYRRDPALLARLGYRPERGSQAQLSAR